VNEDVAVEAVELVALLAHDDVLIFKLRTHIFFASIAM
jgi:hypothetical protein